MRRATAAAALALVLIFCGDPSGQTPPPGHAAPQAVFTSSCTDLSCTFTDGSTDSDGAIVSRTWDYGDSSPVGSEPRHTYGAEGTYTVTLTVTDDHGSEDAAEQEVMVTAPVTPPPAENTPPTAGFTSSCSALSCTFIDESWDGDGSIAGRSWSYGDESPAGLEPSHTYLTGGTYHVTLTVTDDDGARNSLTQTVTVSAPNAAPTAAFTASCNALACSFTDGSNDPDGTIASRSWSFGDGSTSTAESPTHTYNASGNYTVGLTLIDDDGAIGSTTRAVTVASEDIVFIGAGDIAGCSSDFKDRETAAIVARHPNATVFVLGDNAYEDGTLTQYTQCYGRSWGAFKSRTRPTPGNHEYQTSGATDYFQYFGSSAGPGGRGYYSFNLGAWHIISLNSEIDVSATSAQATWLKQDLADNSAQCTIAYWHKPLFTSALQHPNETKMRPLFTILYNAGAEIVMSGHNHLYERFAPQRPDATRDDVKGIREFVVGGGGHRSLYSFTATPQPNSEVRYRGWGVLKLTLKAASYTWEFLPIEDQSFADTGTGVCH